MKTKNMNDNEICAMVRECASESLLDTNTQTQPKWIKVHLSDCSDCRREVQLLHLIENDILELPAHEYRLCTKRETRISKHSTCKRRHVQLVSPLNRRSHIYIVAACFLLLSCLAIDKIQPNIANDYMHTSQSIEDTNSSARSERSWKQEHNMNAMDFNKETNLNENIDPINTTKRTESRIPSQGLTRISKNATQNAQKRALITQGNSIGKRPNSKASVLMEINHIETVDNYGSSVPKFVMTCNSSAGIFGRKVHS